MSNISKYIRGELASTHLQARHAHVHAFVAEPFWWRKHAEVLRCQGKIGPFVGENHLGISAVPHHGAQKLVGVCLLSRGLPAMAPDHLMLSKVMWLRQ